MTQTIFGSVLAMLFGDIPAKSEQSRNVRNAVLSRARRALRAGNLELTASLIEELDEAAERDPASLNLLGLIAEARSDWTEARRCWGKALRANHSYQPAYENLRRWFELNQWGSTRLKVAYGDEPETLRPAAKGKYQ